MAIFNSYVSLPEGIPITRGQNDWTIWGPHCSAKSRFTKVSGYFWMTETFMSWTHRFGDFHQETGLRTQKCWLVVWTFFCPYIGNVIIPTELTHILQRGRYTMVYHTTNQKCPVRHFAERQASMGVGTRYRLAPRQDDLRFATKQCLGIQTGGDGQTAVQALAINLEVS